MAARRARIAIADQQQLFRQSLARHLQADGHLVVCEAEDIDALDRSMIDTEPDIVILDRYLPGRDVLEFVHVLNTLQPQLPILLLVAYEHEAASLQGQAFMAGAAGCLSKDLPASAYLDAIQHLQAKHVLFSADIMRRALRPPVISGPKASLQELTSRELEVLQLISQGLSNREISARLDITYNTVMKHVSNILATLKKSTRMEAGLLYLEHASDETRPKQRPPR